MSEIGTVLLVGGDLRARARLEAAAGELGATLRQARPGALAEVVEELQPDVVVVDLDEGRDAVVAEVAAARDVGLVGRVVGYFSHVDAALGAAARAVGIEAFPRGAFWRTLPEVLRRA